MGTESTKKSPENTGPGESTSMAAKSIVRRALKASLATLDRRSGFPYASLVTVATEPDGAPILLISKLALHTQNLEADSRASLLFDETGAAGDPLAGDRVTLIGRLTPASSDTARRRFLARHPEAEMYAGFADFGFYALALESAHFIGGFGRIVDLPPTDMLLEGPAVSALAADEVEIVEHMNADHAATVTLYATVLCGAPGGPWMMTGIDTEGCDLLCDGDRRRLVFAERISNAEEARSELVRLAGEARSGVNRNSAG
jgi:heme oxygenase (biliverdin-IX-beta and delta-forming)